MRRRVAQAVALLVMVVLAACTDGTDKRAVVPTEPSLALADVCSGSLASQIAKEQKDLFTGAALTTVQDKFKVIKQQCPNVFPALTLDYIKAVIANKGTLPISSARATLLVNHWGSVTNFATGTPLVRSNAVFTTGGAAVLLAGESMLTWDGLAGLTAGGTAGSPHLYTFEPSTVCADGTALRPNGSCYDVKDYPHETVYSPPAIVGICLHTTNPTAIAHAKTGFGTEVLPPAGLFLPPAVPGKPTGCDHVASAMDGWLGRDAGPLGRAVARAYDYLRPKPLFADDAGVSGFLNNFSPVGGFLTDIFAENFNSILANGPDIGDALQFVATSPGYIQLAGGLGNLGSPTDSVVVLSQAQGNCANCPVFSLLGTRVNATETETVGTYEVTWQSLQNKPNIKEAPFVILNSSGAEIARVSYTTESSVNKIRFNGVEAGNWVQNVAQSFKVTVRLTQLNGLGSKTATLSIDGGAATTVAAPNAETLGKIGYILTGIDAGIIASDNWKISRKPDTP